MILFWKIALELTNHAMLINRLSTPAKIIHAHFHRCFRDGDESSNFAVECVIKLELTWDDIKTADVILKLSNYINLFLLELKNTKNSSRFLSFLSSIIKDSFHFGPAGGNTTIQSIVRRETCPGWLMGSTPGWHCHILWTSLWKKISSWLLWRMPQQVIYSGDYKKYCEVPSLTSPDRTIEHWLILSVCLLTFLEIRKWEMKGAACE